MMTRLSLSIPNMGRFSNRVKNEMGQQSARISPVDGESEESDAIKVAELGAKLSEKQAAGFFDGLKNYKP